MSAANALETPSGKGRRDENFPVGSWLIRRDLRAHVHAFYRFARIAVPSERIDARVCIVGSVVSTTGKGTLRNQPAMRSMKRVGMKP